MEVQENLRKNPNEDYLRKISQNNSKGKDIWVAVLNILLAIITVVLLGYIAYKNGYIDLDNILNIQEDVEDKDQGEGSEDSIGDLTTLETYEGKYFTAVVPVGWEITEFENGEGTTMMSSDETAYTGLTGILITNNNEEIMKIEGVSGIGFIGCPELPRFKDTDPDYEKKQEDLVSELGEEIEYLDFTKTPYSEFNWLDKRVRRVKTAIYYDTIEDDEYFQPQCEVPFLRIEGFGFEDEDGNRGDTYMYTISEKATREQLENLDKILMSMAII
jgi:hypothetical protein